MQITVTTLLQAHVTHGCHKGLFVDIVTITCWAKTMNHPFRISAYCMVVC